jgi:hypothetical protein
MESFHAGDSPGAIDIGDRRIDELSSTKVCCTSMVCENSTVPAREARGNKPISSRC